MTAPFWWEPEIDGLAEQYRDAAPFPHVLIDDFWSPRTSARIAADEFGDVGSARWRYHRHYNQKTYSRTDEAEFGADLRDLLERLGSPWFLDILGRLTGIDGLFLDPGLEDAGLAATGPGGFLNLHSDLTVHPDHPHWLRRVNAILYLNPDWSVDYGGDLELWDARSRHCVQRIAPLMNRCVIFNVGADTVHGFPDPLRCPEDRSRQCLTLYYFTDEREPQRPHYVHYRPRPSDGAQRLLMRADNALVSAYERFGKRLGINDEVVDRILRIVRRKR